MPKLRMKLDYNHLMEQIGYILSNSRSKIVRDRVFVIEIGLNLLTADIKEIAERALEINDEKIIEILLDMGVLKERKE